MNPILIYFLFISLSIKKSDTNNYASDLLQIANEFKENIFDEDECTRLKNDADDISDAIEEDLEDDDYSIEDKDQLKVLLKKAEALEDYIASVGNCGNYIPSIEDFNVANSMVGGNVSAIITDKYCVNVISVTIGDYICYLAENNTTKNFKVAYKWAAPNGILKGDGTMGLYGKSVRHIFDNRDEPDQSMIIVSEIECTEF